MLIFILQFDPSGEVLGCSVAGLGEEGAHVVAPPVGRQVGVDGVNARVDVGEVGLAIVERGEEAFTVGLGGVPRVWLCVEPDGVVDELLGGGRRPHSAPRIVVMVVSAAVLQAHAL
jgi:hypothetical protein